MAQFFDSRYDLPLGDPDVDPLGSGVPCPADALARARARMIVSASGWRTVCAADGDEDSAIADVAPADRELVALAGAAFARHVAGELPASKREVLLAVDARPTGGVLADLLLRVLLSSGFGVRYLFISPIPEVIAYAASRPEVGAFLYVSASHNPLGHNGLKFGRAGEGVLPADASARVAARFDTLCGDEAARARVAADARAVSPGAVGAVFGGVSRSKKAAAAAYRRFSLAVADGPVGEGSAAGSVAEGVSRTGCGIVIDFNGSARAASVDMELLRSLGIDVRSFNDRPRQVVHQILPEGAGLEPARDALAVAASADPRFSLAYMPDNDGDRGNLVFAGAASELSAQEVFATAVVAELGWLAGAGLAPSADTPWAVVVNGPTSLRIERIAAAFGAEVHRCEVGEANVVETAARLRRRGYLVRILGEGSNGGNILHPSAVRDPMATVFSFLKLLYAGRGTDRDLFRDWTHRTAAGSYRRDFTLEDVRRSLPRFETTGTGETGAKLRVRTTDHALLKERYAGVFAAEWQRRRGELEKRFSIRRYEEIRYEGTKSYTVVRQDGMPVEAPSGGGPGGFKIQFYDAEGEAVGFLWMRGSGTEPVFRAVVDIETENPADEDALLDWHRGMIERADRGD